MRNPDLVQIEQRFHGAEFRLGRSINQTSDARLNDRTYTHHTRLDGHVERQSSEPVVPNLARRLAHSDDFCVPCRIHSVDRLVEAGRNDLLVVRQHCSDRNLTQVKRMARFLEGEPHHSLLRPDSRSPRSNSRILDSGNSRKSPDRARLQDDTMTTRDAAFEDLGGRSPPATHGSAHVPGDPQRRGSAVANLRGGA